MPNPTSPFSDDSIDQSINENPQVLNKSPFQPSTPSGQGLSKPLLGAMLAGTLADGITTNMSLGRGNRETNALLPQNRIGNALGIGASGIGLALLANELAKHGHPTIAKVIASGNIGTSYIDSLINASAISSGKKQ